jgi:hypothetical protein
MYRKEKNCVQDMAGRFEEREILDELGVDRGDNKNDVKDKEWETVDWIRVNQDGAQCLAFANTAINFRVP